jgi:outer membrane protein assembly factor BamB
VDQLICLDQSSGKALWNATLTPTADVCNVFGFSPAYDDGLLFLTGSKVVCLNATNGTEQWSYSFPTKRGSVDGGAAVADGRVIVGDWDGHNYYCLDEYTGKEIWNFTVMGNAQSTPAIADDLVVLAGWEWGMGGRVYCLNLEDGTEIWNLSTNNSPCGSADLDRKRAYLTTYNFEGDGDVLAISLQNGSLLWQKSIASSDCTPALSLGRLYVCGGTDGFSDKATYCFDAENGSLIWKTKPDDEIGDWRCSPAYADGLIFVGQTENMNYTAICALDAITGKTIWSYPAGGSAPAVAGSMVYTIGGSRVYAFGDECNS